MNDDERVEILYHGTSGSVANAIFAQRRFDLRETFFTADKALAWFFAERSCRGPNRAAKPAVLVVPVYLDDLLTWKKSRLVVPKPFDSSDAPALRGKIQTIFSAEAVRLLNIYSLDGWHVEPQTQSASAN